MKISRETAIEILKYCFKNPKFYFPFIVVCKEYTPEDDDFVELAPEEWETIEEDEYYQTFEIWENLQNLDEITLKLMLKGFIDKIRNETLEGQIKTLLKGYEDLYKEDGVASEEIIAYGENEFFGGKKEAFEEMLELMKKYNL